MPRTKRLVLDGGCYHVLTRGNNRAVVFHEADDFQRYGRLLLDYFTEHRVRLYHYCLMSSHVHLVVEVAQAAGLSKAMHGLNMRYAQFYRRRHQHVGHFWQDRFKSLLVAKDDYLIQCGAYVELNPVRAGMVERPEQYPWSSYRAYTQEGHHDPLVTLNPLYASFGITPADRQWQYRRFVEGQAGATRDPGMKQRALGSPTFLESLESRFGCRVTTRRRGRPRAIRLPS